MCLTLHVGSPKRTRAMKIPWYTCSATPLPPSHPLLLNHIAACAMMPLLSILLAKLSHVNGGRRFKIAFLSSIDKSLAAPAWFELAFRASFVLGCLTAWFTIFKCRTVTQTTAAGQRVACVYRCCCHISRSEGMGKGLTTLLSCITILAT